MTIYMLSGVTHKHRGCEGHVQDGLLFVWEGRPMGFGSGRLVATYPLTSLERWEPNAVTGWADPELDVDIQADDDPDYDDDRYDEPDPTLADTADHGSLTDAERNR